MICGYLMLVSSNGYSQNKQVCAKQFKQLKYDLGCQTKATQLNLNRDIQMIVEMAYQSNDRTFKIIESSKSKSLLTLEQIKAQIQLFKYQGKDGTMFGVLDYANVKNSQKYLKFFYSGHGFKNGDLCIQTRDCPEGQRLTIQQILDWTADWSYRQIIIDACYSGNNAERAEKYFGQRTQLPKFSFSKYFEGIQPKSFNKYFEGIQPKSFNKYFEGIQPKSFNKYFEGIQPKSFKIKCSSGKNDLSSNTKLGGLLILRQYQEWIKRPILGSQKKYSRLDAYQKQLQEMFEKQNPIGYKDTPDSFILEKGFVKMEWGLNCLIDW